MRLPKSAYTARSWRIHDVTPDFRLEDVWALPTPGERHDFPHLVQLVASFDPSRSSSTAVRTLFAIRWRIGRLLGWDAPGKAGRGSDRTLRDRLPHDLREAAAGPDPGPFSSVYLLQDEWAAETVNRTVHGVMHLSWVSDGRGRYRGQMAVLVKPNGRLGTGYMTAIAPFRRLIVYPRMLRELGRRWQTRVSAEQEPVG